ncbi:hypothetical protein PQQ59_17485 [Paraburkholderia aspalathi]|uniref:hypothetical protein n=1 Tax=Paraburkholderia aspalathi TaxID=1324617 RepID=UPI0038BBCA1B
MHVLDEMERDRARQYSPIPVAMQVARTSMQKPAFGKRGAKLNPAKVRDIRQALAAGVSCAELAIRFNVTKAAVEHVQSGRSWADVA